MYNTREEPWGVGRVGGMYKWRLSGFSNSDVEILPFLIVMVKSIKSTVSLGGLNSQVRPG